MNGIGPVAFVADGSYIVGGDGEIIRCWKVEDGLKEDGEPMYARSVVRSIAVSRGGNWIVGGTESGRVTVWDAETRKKVTEFTGHNKAVSAVDISPDGTKIATGSDDGTASVWSLSTGKQLLGPFKLDYSVAAVKIFPDGRLIAVAKWRNKSVSIYESHNGRRLGTFPIQVSSPRNQSLAWASDSEQLFALSFGGVVHSLDVSTGQILSSWAIRSQDGFRCIALASSGTFIAASDESSVSFWDIGTHKQIGSLIRHPGNVWFMAISANHGLIISGGGKIVLRNLPDILPPSYLDNVGIFPSRPGPKQTYSPHTTLLAATDTRSPPHEG